MENLKLKINNNKYKAFGFSRKPYKTAFISGGKIMQKLKILLFFVLYLFINFNISYSKSMYYFEDFSTFTTNANSDNYPGHTNGWTWNFRMSRDLMAFDIDGTATYGGLSAPAIIRFTNFDGVDRRIGIFGRPNNSDLMWNNWYIGDGIKFNPKSNAQLGFSVINATPENPFGYTIVRYDTFIDSDGRNDNVAYCKAFISAWLAEDNGAWTTNENYNNFIYFYDKGRADVNNLFGYFYNVENDIPFANLQNDIDNINIGNNNYFNVVYDNNNAGTRSIYYGTSYPNSVVKTPLGIKLTTDGTTTRIYVNFNPTNDLSTTSNSWVLVGERNANIMNDIIVFLGSETCFFREEAAESHFDKFLIRTVTSNITASIYPQKVLTNSLVRFTNIISNFNDNINNSGIGEIIISKPSTFVSNWILTSVIVSNSVFGFLTNSYSVTNPPPYRCAVYTNSNNELVVRFNMTSSGVNQIITNNNAVIVISYQLWTPPTIDQLGSEFSVYADCVKHFDTAPDIIFQPGTGLKYATTGRKKSYPAYTDSLKVKTYSLPKAYASVEVSPSILILGNEEADFRFKLSTIGIIGSPDISLFRIRIPDGFKVLSNFAGPNGTNIISSKLGTALSMNNIKITNFGSETNILINYLPVGGFAGSADFDTITFKVYGTPTDIPSGLTNTNYIWHAQVDSAGIIAGTTWQMATNTNGFTNLFVTVAMSNALSVNAIYPDKCGISTNYASNYFTYYISNVGPLGNNIRRIRITVPDDITNIVNLKSDLIGTNSTRIWYAASNKCIYIMYNVANTNIPSGLSDRITFVAHLSNTNVNTTTTTNVGFICYADNDNGTGYQLQSQNPLYLNGWNIDIVPPKVEGENYLSPVIISSTKVTNIITNYIFNVSPRGVNVSLVKIEMPTNFFGTILSVTSTYSPDVSISIVTNVSNGTLTNDGTNYIYLNYSATNLYSVYDYPGTHDKVIIKFIDTVRWDTFQNFVITNVKLNTIVYKTATENTQSNNIDLCLPYVLISNGLPYQQTNELYFENPPVDIAYSIGVVHDDGTTNNVIDSTTYTNLITYYVTNRGEVGNRILALYIPIPLLMTEINNVIDIQVSTNNAVGSYNSASKTIVITNINYDTGVPLMDGGDSLTITFKLIDNIEKDKNYVWFYPSATNDREFRSGINNVIAGFGGLEFLLPRPKGGIDVMPAIMFANDEQGLGKLIPQTFKLVITNRGHGSDRYGSILINLPEQLRYFDSSYYSISNLIDPGLANINFIPSDSVTNIQINYSNANTNIPAGLYDIIWITVNVTNRLSNLVTDNQWGYWQVFADNGGNTNFPLTNVVGNTNLWVTERLIVNNNGDCLVTLLTNNFTYLIRNGNLNENLKIKSASIEIPMPPYYTNNEITNMMKITTISGMTNFWYTNIGGKTLIWLDGELKGNQQVLIEFTNVIKDLMINGDIVDWKLTIYYESNYGEGLVAGNDSVRIKTTHIISPADAYFYAYIVPNSVNKDYDYGEFELYITNVGEYGNNIFRAKIYLPTTDTNNYNEVVTNITDIYSMLAGNLCIYSNASTNNTFIYIDYQLASTNIPSGGFDKIYFKAWDNQTNEGYGGADNVLWKVKAYNKPEDGEYYDSLDPIEIGKKLTYKIANPEYASSYQLSPTTMSALVPGYEYTLNIFNTSYGNNNITNIRIYLPSPLLTNGLQVISSLTNPLTLKFGTLSGTNYVDIGYPSNIFVPKTNDVLKVYINDNIQDNGGVNIRVEAMFTAAPALRYQSFLGGDTNRITFVKQNPDFYAYVYDSDTAILMDNDYWDYHFVITNAAGNNYEELSNYIYKVRIEIPGSNDVFTNFALVNSLRNPVMYFDETNIYLLWTNNNAIENGNYDIVTIRGWDKNETGGFTNNWVFYGLNVTNDDDITYASKDPSLIGKMTRLIIYNPGYNSYYYVSPNEVSTFLSESSFQIKVYNVSESGNNITNLRIYINSPFLTNNVLSGLSNILGITVTNLTGNYLEIGYPTNKFRPNSNDTIYITLKDNLIFGNTNVILDVKALYNTSVDKYKDISVNIGTNIVQFIMPDPEFYAYVDNDDINVGMDYDSWLYNFTITNVGGISNNIYKIKIIPPNTNEIITNIIGISSYWSLDTIYSNDGCVYVFYADYNCIKNGGWDTISFVGYDNQDTSGYSGKWQVIAYNYPGSEEPRASSLNPENIGKSLELNIYDPEYQSEYFVVDNEISTVLPDNQIRIFVNNSSKVANSGNSIQSIKVYLPDPFTNKLETENYTNYTSLLSNSLNGGAAVLGYENGTNYIQINYSYDFFKVGSNDTLFLNVLDFYGPGEPDLPVDIDVKVQFFNSGGKFKDSILSGNKTVTFVMPPTKFFGYVDPSDTNIPMDADYWDYDIYITNVGELSNHLYLVKIERPSIYITNMIVLSNLIPAKISYEMDGDEVNLIRLNYSTSNKSISDGGYDVITIRAYDNRTTAPWAGNWSVYGVNSPLALDATVPSSNVALIGKTTAWNIYNPGYCAFYSLETTNVPTLLVENNIEIKIYNKPTNYGAVGNRIKYARVYLPSMFVASNTSLISSTLGGTIITYDTNFFDIDYTSKVFTNNVQDTIIFRTFDTFSYGNTNVNILVGANFDTSVDKFILMMPTNGTNILTFYMKDPIFFGYVDTNDINILMDVDYWDYDFIISNIAPTDYLSLSNHIYKLKIELPEIITNVTYMNSMLGAGFTYVPGFVYVDYSASNKSISNSGYDIITIRGYDDQSVSGYSGNWNFYAANNIIDDPNKPGSNATIFGKSTEINIIDPGYASVYHLLTTNANTLLPENEIKIYLKNTGLSGNWITNVRVYFNDPFTMEFSLISNKLGYVSVKTQDNFVEYTYNTNLFVINADDILIIRAKDNWTYGGTNVVIEVKVRYVTSADKFYNANVYGGVNELSFIMPSPDFIAYIDNNRRNVFMDYEVWDYNIIVTNTGGLSNYIYRLSIVPPEINNVITNITNISTLIPSYAYYSNNGVLYIDYYVSNNGIPNDGYDIISFKGYDNQDTNGYIGNFDVFAANNSIDMPNTISKDPTLIGKYKSIEFVYPGYDFYYYVLTSNISTLVPENNIQILISNIGILSNNIESIRIIISEPFTNIFSSITNLLGINSTNVGQNYIEINYNNNTFITNKADIISLNISDNWTYGNTNVDIIVKSKFNTTGNKYKDPLTTPTHNRVDFIMPSADFYAYIADEDQYVNMDNDYWDYELIITNVGSTSNHIYSVKIVPPDIITNIVNINSLYSANIYYSNSNIYVDYYVSNTSIPEKSYDIISFRGFDNITTNSYDGLWKVYAANATNELPEVESKDPDNIGKSLAIHVVNPNYGSEYNILTTSISSVLDGNEIAIYVVNTGSPGNFIRRIKLYIPDPFITNNPIVNSNLLNNAVIDYTTNISGSNYIVVNYLNSDFVPGVEDVVYINIKDNWSHGDTNVNLSLYAQYNTSADKFIESTLKENQTVNFVMPDVKFYGYVKSEDRNVPELAKYWDYNIIITNIGELSNHIYKVKITPPDNNNVITNSVVLTNRIPATISYFGADILIDYYTDHTNSIWNNDYDEIVIRGYDNQETNGYSGAWTIKAANWPTYNEELGEVPPNESTVINFVTPNYASIYDIKTQNISTLLDYNTLAISIKNNSLNDFDNYITKVRIYLGEPFTNENLTLISNKLSNESWSTGIENGTNYLEIIYLSNSFSRTIEDYIVFNIKDNWEYDNTKAEVFVDVVYNTSYDNYIKAECANDESVINFVMPQVAFYGYVDSLDINIPYDADYWYYDIIITNIGGLSNKIYKVEITPPDNKLVITNIQFVSNIIPGKVTINPVVNSITIEYYISNNYMQEGSFDRIVLKGYDNQVLPGYYGLWSIKAANWKTYQFAEGADETSIGKSRLLSIYYPGYSSAYYVINPIGNTFYNENTFMINITNNSIGNNTIEKVKIKLFDPFTNNIIYFSNTLGYYETNIQENYIEITYNTNVFKAGSNDIITITIPDNWEYGNKDQLIEMEAIYDTTFDKYKVVNVDGRGSNIISLVMPAPGFYGYIDNNATNILFDYDYYDYMIVISNVGGWSNNIYKINIIPPKTNEIITNIEILSNLKGNSIVKYENGIIIIDYTLTNFLLYNNDYDILWIRGYDNVTNELYAGKWKFYGVNNNFDDVVTSSLDESSINKSSDLRFYDSGYDTKYYVTPNEVSTLYPENNFTIYIENTGTLSNYIEKVKLYLPSPLLTNNFVLSNKLAIIETNSGNENGTNYIEISYSGSGIMSKSNDVIELKLKDNIDYGEALTAITVKVSYNTSIGKYKNAAVMTEEGLFNTILFKMPVSKFYVSGKSDTTNIFVERSYWDYEINITNVGELYNNIYKLKIEPPMDENNEYIITNIVILLNSIPAAIDYISGVLYIDFSKSNTNIGYGKDYRLVFRGYDTIESPGFYGLIGIYAANNTNVLIPDDKPLNDYTIKFDLPAYKSEYYVLPNEISTIESSNIIQIVVRNIGETGHNINSIRFQIVNPFITNNLSILSNNISISNWFLTNISGKSYIYVNYINNKFLPGSNDVITMRVFDNYLSGNTNVNIRLDTKYNTSLDYVNSIIKTGFTNLISFVMPEPNVNCTVSPIGIYNYNSITNSKVKFTLINTGKGSNIPKYMDLRIDNNISNNMMPTNLTTHTNNIVELTNDDMGLFYRIYFSNFVINSTNELYLNIINDKDLNLLTFNIIIDNGGNNTNFDINIPVVKAPTAELLTRTAYSTRYSNYVEINFINNSQIDLPVYRLRITPPIYYTNVKSINLGFSNQNNGIISNQGKIVTITYTNGLIKGAREVISMWVYDSNDMYIATNLEWIIEADNGSGFGKVRENYFGALKQDIIIPTPEVSNIVRSMWFEIKIGNQLKTNEFIIEITNIGDSANGILTNKIVLPSELTSIYLSTLKNTMQNSKITKVSNIIYIIYTNQNGMMPGKSDTISFIFTNNITSPKTIQLEVYNYNNSHLGFKSETFNISFIAPQEPTEGYVMNRKVIYSIDTYAEVKYKVVNGMFDIPIEKLYINFDTTRLKITNIYSSILSNKLTNGNINWTETPSNIIIDYLPYGGLPGKLDISKGIEELTFSITYKSSNSWTNDMKLKVKFMNRDDLVVAEVPKGERNILPVLYSDFGRMRGIVLPPSAKPTVKLYYAGTTVIATNRVGEEIGGYQIVSANAKGEYFIDFVSPGYYDVAFYGVGYRETRMSNVVMYAGVEITNNLYYMKRNSFNPDAKENQITESLHDTNTRIIIPVGAIQGKDNFAVDIWITNIKVINNMLDKAKNITTINNADAIRVFDFEITSGIDEETKYDEQRFTNDIILILSYKDEDIQSLGWDESKLAIYYWREMSKEWVRIGGKVDTANNTITAKVSYLHKYYTILQDSLTPIIPGFVTVKTDPRIFTPDAQTRSYKNVKITINFENPVDKFEFKIYDKFGNLIRKFERTAEYGQGEVYWDGLDDDGYMVKSGAYIYRVIAGDKVFSGVIIVVR